MKMKKIRALRQFSHYHAGNFDQFEVRNVPDEYAKALIGMELAEAVAGPPIPEPTTTTSKKPGSKNDRNRHGSDID
ncbi:hypothetical protein [Pseudomonas sp. R5(2019)]|uniref:hypothetical protein n=1 Tax=Pseudomonas sp. R5(2019) TaxID=2697566 RepID=UPI00141364BA|nr:hypothetical protein [Pseudomonas sp. R5(2019)]NBA95511.1 hypothetical protein [Pseudomonas sp. R5(2019)]